MASSNSTPILLKGKDYRGSSVFVNCKVPSGQVLIEVEETPSSGVYGVYQTITSSQMFQLSCPNAEINVRLTPSGGATVILPSV